MTRMERARAILSEGLGPDSFELQDRCGDAEWLSRYPGGFGPIPPVDDGNVLDVCLERVVHHGRDLLDGQFEQFCEAVRAWQRDTMMPYSMHMEPELILLGFETEHPREAFVLTMVAAHADLPIETFLGATRP